MYSCVALESFWLEPFWLKRPNLLSADPGVRIRIQNEYEHEKANPFGTCGPQTCVDGTIGPGAFVSGPVVLGPVSLGPVSQGPFDVGPGSWELYAWEPGPLNV